MEWKTKKMDVTGGNIVYLGYHEHTNADEDDEYWKILKYTYDGSDIVKIQRSQGSWTNRATLNW